jgi:ATP-dependent helicase/nuclease subunit A
MIRDEASQAQVDAADPLASTWLSANAGSGKTRVLTDRVARLLLEEVDPQNILCLTYTKAAAAEMQNRLFKRLGAWAMMPDIDLRADLETLGFARQITSEELSAARTLFARAIETPGGLKIQTIHSFCSGVLRRFPLEAGVSPQFREMEDRQSELLRGEVMDGLLETYPDVVHGLLRYYTGDDLSRLTAEIAGKRDAFERQISKSDIFASLDLPANASRNDALTLAFQGGEAGIVSDIVEAFADQSATYQKLATTLKSLDLNSPEWSTLDTLFGLFLYANSARSKSVNFPQSNHKKAVEAMAHIADEVHDWMDRIAAAKSHLWAMDAAEKTEALYAFATAFIPAYEARKLAAGALDFDDLIRKTRGLLTDRALAQWVLFRLDGGIDHVLVDEAQDTSPVQWTVIEQLTQEFTAGEGADPDRKRTIFVVGDKKQSIYSFQGADPEAFDQMKHHFADGLDQSGQKLWDRSLDFSFRSSQAILRVVDSTFINERADGLDKRVFHSAFKDQMPGRVDLWPLIEDEKSDDTLDWTKPVDHMSDAHVTVQMANRVADEIKRMITHETLPVEVGNTGGFERRRITEGDVLILVQRRSDLFSEIIRACKAAGLKIAGADRLRLGAELAVKDLTAVLAFLALPEDDLSLASALKSPLFGWSEQQLFTLAHHRPKRGYLWPALRDSNTHEDTLSVLRDLRNQADFLRPYDLIERILTRHDGRRKLLARLGAEAEDGIDALLSQALSYESTAVPSLTGFLSWMETDDVEIKRQMDSQGDRIRVMTVHGAKGLEAPIVFLPDAAQRDNQAKSELFPADDQVVWKMKKDASPLAMEELREAIVAKQAKERMRLLYVAMTRAEKWLIVGAAGKIGEGDDSWYNIVSDGMMQAGDANAVVGDMTVRRVTHLDWEGPTFVSIPDKVVTKPAMPTFAPLQPIVASKTLSPSNLKGAKIIPGDPGGDNEEDAKSRGTQVHLLLEHLPQLSAEQRAEIGALLIASYDDFADQDLVGQVCDLLKADHLSHIFAHNALVEVGVTADLDIGARIHGTIDRLLVTEGQVLAVDYKTNRLVPDTADETPEGVLRQLGAYHAALLQIYPNHQIEMAVLWTETATLMQIPTPLVSAALGRVTPP